MNTQPAVLVVDDERVVCNSCNRILSDDGFLVETSTSAWRGLAMAETKDYAVILLDLRMEEMDGLECLERLRGKKPYVPVIIITGYPSPETLDISMQRGASDYIVKPFTPDEIMKSVRRVASRERPAVEPQPDRAVAWRPIPEPPQFLDEAWMRQCEDGQACLGAFLPRLHGAQIDSVRLPRMGDMVHRGLPLAALALRDNRPWIIPSPLSGTVTEVHRALARHPELLWQKPFSGGWIARIRPSRLGEEVSTRERRGVVLVSDDQGRAGEIRSRLVDLGCDVHIHNTALGGRDLGDPGVLVVDACSCGEDGVLFVERVNRSHPELKVIVLGDGESHSEAAHRANRIFYYAVEPFEDLEIADILFDAFRAPRSSVEEDAGPGLLPEFLSRVRMTNRRGQRVTLLAEKSLLSRTRGLGRRLVDRILDGFHPTETTRTARPAALEEAEILREADECDVLLVLRTGDTGRAPGSVVLQRRNENTPMATTTLSVQVETSGHLPLSFDARTTEALAEFILRQMV